MNGLHLFLVALLLHRALVWRDERRDRDLLIGALLGGLCVSNHGLAITVVPIVVLFVLADARREIAARPVLLVKAGAAFALGLLPYLYLPLRALAGPAEVYSPFLTLEGLFAHVSGAQFRGDMHFASIDSVKAALSAAPQVSDHVLALSNPVFVALGAFGIALLVVSDRWYGWLLVLLGVVNVYFYANYLGDLSHYLLTGWLVLAIGLAYAGETIVEILVERIESPPGAGRLRDADHARGPARVELGDPRPIGQPRRRAIHGRGVRGAAAGRGAPDLLGRPDAVELQALHRGRSTGCQPAGIRRAGDRDVRPDRTAVDRRGAPTTRLRVARRR